jgi:5-methyltetrahydropteroyltriglutamate--homocysteine methyltransferase
MPKIARADVVGSLLRPAYLLEARKAWREGKLDDAGVGAVEDRAVAEAVVLQENAGIDAITDGEYRRFNFVATMGVRDARDGCLSGFETVETDARWMRLWRKPDGSDGGLITTERGPRSLIVDKIGVRRDAVADEFPFRRARWRDPIHLSSAGWHRVALSPSIPRAPIPVTSARHARSHLRCRHEAHRSRLYYVHLDAPTTASGTSIACAGVASDATSTRADRGCRDRQLGVQRHHRHHPRHPPARGNARGRWLADGGYGRIAAEVFPRLSNRRCS